LNSHFRTIPVLDGNGDQLSLYEFLEPGSLFGLVRRKRYHLCTGELVIKEGDGFVVVSTGEHLSCVRNEAEDR
jgi:hypothetical protein